MTRPSSSHKMPTMERRRRASSCGTCDACTRQDCGTCFQTSSVHPQHSFVPLLTATMWCPERALHILSSRTLHLDPTGQCINCADKPKFGGLGIRKQSCSYRRCLRPKGVDVIVTEQVNPITEQLPSPQGSGVKANLENEPRVQESPSPAARDAAFWTAVEG